MVEALVVVAVAAVLGFVGWLIRRAITASGRVLAAVTLVDHRVALMSQQNESDHAIVREHLEEVKGDVKDMRGDIVDMKVDVAEIRGEMRPRSGV